MNKIKIEELKCFDQVASVIGESRAKVELFKVLQVAEECEFEDEELAIAFAWILSPQGEEFWELIYLGENPSKFD